MASVLVSHHCNARFGNDFVAAAGRDGIVLELLVLPTDPESRIDAAIAARAEAAYFSGDVFPEFSKQFFSATRKASGLKWLQVFNAGIDHPVFATILERGVRLTTSSGSAAEPIAQEPLPPESPLWEMQNVVVTPHNSAASEGNEARVNAIFLDNLKRWTRSEPLVNEVNKRQ